MSFHATAAAIPARPNTLSTFRNHLLCSVCAALLVMGSGAMAQEQPAPQLVEDEAEPPVADTKVEVNANEIREINAGEEIDDLIVNGRGSARIRGGGYIGKGTVNSGGELDVYGGGTAGTVTINGEQAWSFDADGIINGGVGGFAFISGKESRIDKGTVNLGGYMGVKDQAEAGKVTVNKGGKLEVLAGGTAKDVTINGEQAWSFDADGIIDGGVGGFAFIEGVGSRIDKGTVNNGGYMQVKNQAEAGTVTVNSGGRLDVEDGGTVEEATINGKQAWRFDADGDFNGGVGGIAVVSDKGSRIDKGTVNLGGAMVVGDKATAGVITVNTGGGLDVEDGGKVEEVTVNGKEAWDSKGENGIGGFAVISGEGSRIDKGTVNNGGLMNIGNLATAGAITVNSGGWLNVRDGGTAEEVTLNGEVAWDSKGENGIGGTAIIFGENSRINKGTVNLGGWMKVRDQATAGAITVNSGGWLKVKDGGTAEEVTLNGEKPWGLDADGIVNGGIGGSAFIEGVGSRIDKGTVNNGGWMDVRDKATAGAITVNSGGWLQVNNDGQVEEVTLNGGFADVIGYGEIIGKSTVSNGGTLGVHVGGRAGDITLTGGDSAGQTSFAIVNGTAGDITLGANSNLNGFGTIRNLLVHAGGTVYPGTDWYKFATLTATGDVTFDKDSVYSVQIANDGLRASRLEVQGQANLHGGTVNVRAKEYAGKDSQGVPISQFLSKEQSEHLFEKHVVILTAEKGVIGRFDEIKPDYNYITPTLAYTDKTVSVGFDLTGAARTEKAEKLAAEQAAAQTQAEADRLNRQLHEEQIKNIVLVDAVTPNQKSTGHAVLQLGLGNRLLDTVLLSKKGDVLNYDALSGEAHASLRGTLLQDAGLVSGAANERIRAAFDGVAARPVPVITPLAYGPEDKGKQSAGETFAAAAPAASTTALWGQAYGGWSHGASDGNAAAYDRNTGGFVTGVDSLIAGTWRLGVLAGYGSTSLHGAGSSTSADSYQLGVYGGTAIDALTLSLGTILAHHAIDTHRSVTFGSLAETESAGYAANTLHLFGEAAYRIDTAYAAFEPFAAAAYTHLKTDGFTETGGIAALSAPAATADLTTTTLGLRASRAFTLGNATTVTARGMAGWRHAYGDVAPQAQFAFASGGESFAVSGQPIAADTALIEAGLAFDVGKATTIGLTYTGAFSSQVKDNAVKASLAVKF